MELKKQRVYRVHNKVLQINYEKNLVNVTIPTNFSIKVVIGDFIDCVLIDKQWILKKVYERSNLLIRPKAANVDLVLIVYSLISFKNTFQDLLWWIMMYEIYDLNVKVLFTKGDLLEENQKANIQANLDVLNDLKVQFFDYQNDLEINQFLNKLKNKFVILSGYSGAGKSTFLNFLNKNLNIKTKSLSTKTQRGKHTTTASYIYEIKDILLADAPGFSQLNFQLTKEQISYAWKKFHTLQTNCKFTNCLHNNLQDLNCGVIQALKAKQLLLKTYEIYLNFLNSAKK